jgi:hypothetical protein
MLQILPSIYHLMTIKRYIIGNKFWLILITSFLFSMSSRLALGTTQPPIQWVPGDLLPGVKRLGHKADHSPPTSAEVKKRGSIQPLPHMSSWCSASLVEHWG